MKQAGDFEGALENQTRALALGEKHLGPDHPELVFTLGNLAQIQRMRGEYAESELLVRRALGLSERAFGPAHPLTLTLLGDLAVLRMSEGDDEAALVMCREVRAVREQSQGGDHPDLANVLVNEALLEDRLGRHAAADTLLRRALAIQERAFGGESPPVIQTTINLANVEAASGDVARAEADYGRAIAAAERALGPEHWHLAAALDARGALAVRSGKTALARKDFERALAIQERALGASHPLTGQTRLELARLDLVAGRHASAWEAARRVYEEELELGENLLALASERQALRLACRLAAARDVMMSAAVAGAAARERRAMDTLAERTYAALLRGRGRALDYLAARGQATEASGDPEVRALAARHTRARQRLANLVVQGPDETHPERFPEYLRRAAAEKEEAGSALARALVTGGTPGGEHPRRPAAPSRAKPELGAIRRELTAAGATLVEYVRYRHEPGSPEREPGSPEREPGSPERGLADAAFVAGPAGAIALVPLGRASATDSLVLAYRAAVEDDGADERRVLEAARRLHDAIWAPLATHLPALRPEVPGGEDVVLVLPDASLHLVDFSTLVTPAGRYLIEEWSLAGLSSAADLPRVAGKGALLEAGRPAPIPLLAIGDPDFGLSLAERDRERARLGEGGEIAALVRSAPPPCSGGAPPLPLPGARREIEDLARLAGGTEGGGGGAAIRVTLLRGPQAIEESAKRESQRHRILHFATHGYFLQGLCPRTLAAAHGLEAEVAEQNPLLLTGLLLAGAADTTRPAGAVWEARGPEDGYLTAEEIAALDLSGVDLVVLSACETGRGRIEVGEGVFGLQHAFELAGARTVVMSLWRMPDVTLSDFMRDFYRELTSGTGIAAALRRAKLAALGRAESELFSRHPRYWAGMISSGGWR